MWGRGRRNRVLVPTGWGAGPVGMWGRGRRNRVLVLTRTERKRRGGGVDLSHVFKSSGLNGSHVV